MALPGKLLIVDDDPGLQIISRYTLRSAGFDVLLAGDGETALELAREYRPDLVLLDVNLPRMDGFEVCRRLKSDPEMKSTFVVILSAMAVDTDSKVLGLSIGADGYIERPVANRELVARVQSMLRIRQAEIALQTSLDQWQATFDAVQDAIFLLGTDSTILRCNRAAAERISLPVEELVGKKGFEVVHRPALSSISSLFETAKTNLKREVIQVQENERWMQVSIDPVKDASGAFSGAVCIVSDITERIQAEERIKTALAEKDTLLRELYHRTKNNMQIISALLSLQKDYSNDPAVTAILTEMDNRIQAMSMVHQKLYQSRNLSNIDLGEYLRELSALLEDSYKAAPGIGLFLDLESISVTIDLAIPCGLVLNELVSNALKYAFPGGGKGVIKVSLRSDAGRAIHLTVSDNGVGLPEGFSPRQDGKLGMQTLFALVEHQLRGKIEFVNDSGLTVDVQFPDSLYQ
jgi:PAS domain S-box-containing protein